MTIKPDVEVSERRISMSYEDFFSQIEESVHAEWVNGETILFMPPKRKHQLILVFCHELLRRYASARQLGLPVIAPFEMKIHPEGNAREPDLLFIRQANLHRLTEDRLVGPADLIVEVISADSLGRDRGEKFDEYQQGGVEEYWILDPRPGHERIDGFALEKGRYRAILPDARGRLHSRVVAGFWFEESWLLSAEPPDPDVILAGMTP